MRLRLEKIKDFKPKKILKVEVEDDEWMEKYHIRNIDKVKARLREEKRALKKDMREKVF
jgi:hypothetical protein